MVSTGVKLAGLSLKNPMIPASGCFGYGAEMAEIYDLNILGAIAVKGTTLEPRFGNPSPRIAEGRGGVLNSVGLQNPGIDAVVSHELPRLRRSFSGPILLNVCGFSVEEYVEIAERLQGSEADAIELNISCPNVHGGGACFGAEARAAAEVVSAARRVWKKPLFVKLTPNVTDIAEIARACEGAGADGLTLINTLLAMRIDLNTRKPVLANVTGGLSGPAVFPVALRMVYTVYEAVKIPIIGCGGVSSAADAVEMMLAGASAVQVGSANLKNPFVCREIVEALPGVMEGLGIKNIEDIIGGAH